MARIERNYKTQEATIKNLETQFGQMGKQLSEGPLLKFLDDIENPRPDNACAITTRSGKFCIM